MTTSTTLATRLKELREASRLCKFAEILNSMDEECRDLITQIISIPQEDSGSVSNVDLVLVLREDGYDIGRSTISEHRREICACYRTGRKE